MNQEVSDKQNKIIDKMLDFIVDRYTCPLEDCDYDLDCDNRCNDQYKECWKLYFEKITEKGI